jgi:hypothetical protein
VAIHFFQKGSRRKGFGGWSSVWGFPSSAVDSWAFSGELVWFAPSLGKGNSLENIYYVTPK